MLFLLKERHLELFRLLDRGVLEGYIVLENFRNGWLFENRLPRALRLAGAAIDALVWVDVELIGIFFPGCGELLIFDTNQQFATHTVNAGAKVHQQAGAKMHHDIGWLLG